MARGPGRLDGRVAVVVGAGQMTGPTIGNGRATALLFAREGAVVVAADRDLASAEETSSQAAAEGGEAHPVEVDVGDEGSLQAMVEDCVRRWGRLDVLHNNVGLSLAGGDAPVTAIEAEAFDRITMINLRGMVLTCKHALPVMRAQRRGSIVNISSIAAVADYPYVAYKTSKAGVVAFTRQVALDNARHGVRANVILPGLIDTPMAVDTRVQVSGRSREEIVAERDAQVPMGRMGTAWDVAAAALFLASDDARFVTGVALPVDGGQSARVG
jgi:NAD(P)-dependent dehydrogenase (short-subunit alcohol dehydrogenase family)